MKKTHWMVLVAELLLLVCGSLMMVSDKIMLIPIVPPELAQWWPMAIIVAAALESIARKVGDFFDDGILNDSFRPGDGLHGRGGPYGPGQTRAADAEQRRKYDEAARKQRGHVVLEALGWIVGAAFLVACCVGLIWVAFLWS